MSAVRFAFADAVLLATPTGALWWKSQATLVVADLHLEKGSSLARRGTLLPPYDTRATLGRLAALVDALAPRRVICLGDSFHDVGGPGRLGEEDAARLATLARGRDWLWIAGNHDPAPGTEFPGTVVAEAALGPLVFRHQAAGAGAWDGAERRIGEVSGHYHPKASVRTAGGRLTGRCFATDGRRLILPAFGAYTGGLCVLDPAIASLLAPPFTAHLIGRSRVHTFASPRLSPIRTATGTGWCGDASDPPHRTDARR